MNSTRDVIVRLLRSLGTRKEVDQYLKQYSSEGAQKFAVTKVGGGTLARDTDALCSSLTFLQHVGLLPVVIHGAGPQLDDAAREEGLVVQRLAGRRVVDPRTLELARKVVLRENLRLVEGLEELGTRARPVTSGVFEVRSAEPALGAVGDVAAVHTDAVLSCVRAGVLPVVAALGETTDGRFLYVDADVAAVALARTLAPYKLIFLSDPAGVVDGDGNIVSAVNLAEDYERMREEPWMTPPMRRQLRLIKELLDDLPLSSSVSITSPDRLAKELFTHTGSGTLIRRGERVLRFESLEGVDRPRLRELLEVGFGRLLAEDYFELKEFFRVYLADSYRATAILTRDTPIPYLDKFAVTAEAQGAGIGGSLWARMKAENPKLFWRARAENDINPWYFQQAQGTHREGRWVVFYYGLEGWDEIRSCIDYALAQQATMHEKPLEPGE
jgi:acetylglutamate kinase